MSNLPVVHAPAVIAAFDKAIKDGLFAQPRPAVLKQIKEQQLDGDGKIAAHIKQAGKPIETISKNKLPCRTYAVGKKYVKLVIFKDNLVEISRVSDGGVRAAKSATFKI